MISPAENSGQQLRVELDGRMRCMRARLSEGSRKGGIWIVATQCSWKAMGVAKVGQALGRRQVPWGRPVAPESVAELVLVLTV